MCIFIFPSKIKQKSAHYTPQNKVTRMKELSCFHGLPIPNNLPDFKVPTIKIRSCL